MAKILDNKSNNLGASQLQIKWRRLPKRGESFCGLGRPALNELCLAGAIESRLIIRPNAKRGIRIYSEESLQAYLDNGGNKEIRFPQSKAKGANDNV